MQIVSVKGDAGVDTGDLDENEVAELFGKSSGFTAAAKAPVDIADPPNDEEDF